MSPATSSDFSMRRVQVSPKRLWLLCVAKSVKSPAVRPTSEETSLLKYRKGDTVRYNVTHCRHTASSPPPTKASSFILVTPEKRSSNVKQLTPSENQHTACCATHCDAKNTCCVKRSCSHQNRNRGSRWLRSLASFRRAATSCRSAQLVQQCNTDKSFEEQPTPSLLTDPAVSSFSSSPTASYRTAISRANSVASSSSSMFSATALIRNSQAYCAPRRPAQLSTPRSADDAHDRCEMSLTTVPVNVKRENPANASGPEMRLVSTEASPGDGETFHEMLEIAKACCGRWITILERSESLDAQYRILGISTLKRAVMNRLAITLTLFLEENDTLLHCWVHTPLGIRHMRSSLVGKEVVDDDPDAGRWTGVTQAVNYSISWFPNGSPVRALQQVRRNPKIGVCVETRCVISDPQEGKVMFFNVCLTPHGKTSTTSQKAFSATRILRYVGEVDHL